MKLTIPYTVEETGLSDPHSLTRWWERNRAGLGIDCTLHDLRRS